MSTDHKYRPPKWATQFLHLYCPEILLEEIEGDLYENFYRNLEYTFIRPETSILNIIKEKPQ